MTDQAQTPTPETATITTDAVPLSEPVQDNSTAEPASFLDQLSADQREAPGLKKFEKGGVDALAKSYLSLEAKLASGDKFALPKGTFDEDPDGWETVFEKLGRPEGADKYSFLDEAETDPLLTPYAETSHKLGLNDAQAKGLYDWFRTEQAQLSEKMLETGREAMKKEWGPEYASKLSVADEYLGERISPQLSTMLKASGIAHNPEFVKLIHEAAATAREDASFRGDESAPTPATLPDNPYARDTPAFNLTRQGQIERSNPDLANRYRKEAGYAGY